MDGKYVLTVGEDDLVQVYSVEEKSHLKVRSMMLNMSVLIIQLSNTFYISLLECCHIEYEC